MKKRLFVPVLAIVFLVLSCLQLPAYGQESSRVDTTLPGNTSQLTIWINAFIPSTNIKHLVKVPKGAHQDKMAILFPPTGICYLTDNRGFDTSVLASHRMQSLVRIDLDSLTYTHVPSCNNTIGLKKPKYIENCNRTPDTSRIRLLAYSVQSEDTLELISFILAGSTHNACIKGAPNVGWRLPVTIALNKLTNKIRISIQQGLIESFPSFEMYVRLDNIDVVTIFRESARPQTTPKQLYGKPKRIVNYSEIIN